MINRVAPTAPPQVALTNIEINIPDRIRPDTGHQALQRAGSRRAALPPEKALSHYLYKIACLGGYLARAHAPLGNIIMWRRWQRLNDIAIGFSFEKAFMDN